MLLVQEATTPGALAKARGLVDDLPLVENLLVHADLNPPLDERTRVFFGFDAATGDLRAVATAYLGFGKPALGVATLPSWDEAHAVAVLKAVKEGVDLPAIAIDDVSREKAYASVFRVTSRFEEVHYVLGTKAPLPVREDVPVARVPREQLDRLDAFLRKHGATAWSRESFATGAYFWVLESSEPVAAAGVHFETPLVGQIANVLVRADCRGRGLGTAVTTAVARRLRLSGKVVSLFVASGNAAARHVYERMGFRPVRHLAGLELA